MAHTRSMLEKHTHAHAQAPGHPHPQAQKGERARAHTHAQREIYHTYCLSMATVTRERAPVLRYTYTACLVQYLQTSKINFILPRNYAIYRYFEPI